KGVIQDYGKAREWYQKAADAGNTHAMNELGLLYAKGLGGAQDYGKAREWYQKAADAGNTHAMNELAWLYQNGKAGAQDYGKAREWYQKAADAGNAEAKHALSDLREQEVATIDFTPLYKGEMNLWISSRSENFSSQVVQEFHRDFPAFNLVDKNLNPD